MKNVIIQAILQAAPIVITGVCTVLINFMRSKYSKYINDQTKKEVAVHTVEYIEQLYKDIHGEEKFIAAKKKADKLLSEKNIPISQQELEVLIESAVHYMNSCSAKNDDTKRVGDDK